MKVIINDYYACSISNEDRVAFNIKDEDNYTLITFNLFDENLIFDVNQIVNKAVEWLGDSDVENITIEIFEVTK